MSLQKKEDTHARFDARPEDRLKRLDHIAEDALEFTRARCRERRECEAQTSHSLACVVMPRGL